MGPVGPAAWVDLVGGGVAAALHAAHTAGDRALAANILGFAACQAKDLNQTSSAVHLAQTAIAGYPGASSRVAAILHLSLAEAHAKAGDPAATRAALDTAFDRVSDPSSGSGEPAWCYWLDTAQVHAQAGYCYLTLNDLPRAQEHLHTALALQSDSFHREGALRATLLATAYAHQPDLDQATAVAAPAVAALTGDVASSRCIGHLTRLARQLAPHRRHSGVRDLLDQIHPLTQPAGRVGGSG